MQASNNWFETFFSGVSIDLWLNAIPASHTQKEADAIAAALALSPGADVLDVPCGHGRLAEVLAGRGYRVTGVDLSADALNHARRSSDRVAWEERDMRNLPWPSRFDGAFCFGNSFGYMDDEGNAAFLRAVAGALKPGGRFLLECPIVAESWLPAFKDQIWVKVGDMYLLARNQYDHVRGRFETEYTFVAGGRVDVRYGSQRVYAYRQLMDLMQASGFENLSGETWARDGGTEPYSFRAPTLLLSGTRTRI